MPLVMLKPSWPAESFRRTIRDKARKPLRLVEFPKGKPVELTGEERDLIASDVGHALIDVVLDDKQRPRDPASWKPPQKPTEQSVATAQSSPASADEPPATEGQTDAANSGGRPGRRRSKELVGH
jgi:hypothetical protein